MGMQNPTKPITTISEFPSTPSTLLHNHIYINSPNSTIHSENPDQSHMDDVFYEFIVYMIPCFLFILIALKRSFSLNSQPLPEFSINKQISYKIKRLLSLYHAIVYTFQIFLASLLTPDVYWITEYRYAAAMYLLGIVAWVLSHQLLEKEVERGIYQRFYSHRMFWILHFIVVCIKVSKPIEQHPVPLILNILKLAGGFYLTLYALGKPFDSEEADELSGKTNRLPLIRAILLKIENAARVRLLLGEKPYIKSEPLLYSLSISDTNEHQAEEFKSFLKLHNIKGATSAQAGDWLKYLPIVTCRISEDTVITENEPGNIYYEIKTSVDDDVYTKLHDYKDFLILEAHIKKRYNPLKIQWIDRQPPEFDKIEASSFADEKAFLDARKEILERYLNTLGADPRYMNDKVLDFLGILEPHRSAFLKYFAFMATRSNKSIPIRDSHQAIEMGELSHVQAKKKTDESFVPTLKVRCSHFQKSMYGDYYEYIILVEDTKGPENSWSIIKSYSDFKDLNEKLERTTGKNLPYLNQFILKPRHQNDTTDPGFIQERMRGLDMYINVLLKQPVYHTSALYEFLEYNVKRGTHKSSTKGRGSEAF